MQVNLHDTLIANPMYRELVSSKRRLSFTLTAITVGVYFTFIFIVALAPSFLRRPIFPGAKTSVGIISGVAIILLAIALTGIYVRRSNRVLDPMTIRLLNESTKAN